MNKKFISTYYQLDKSMENGPQDVSLRFVFVSDLHNQCFGLHNEGLLQAIRDLKPDLILVGGDMTVGKPGASFEHAAAFIRKASEEYPLYYGNGNHEYRLRIYPETYGDMYRRYFEAIGRERFFHLVNETADLTVKGIPLKIHGYEMDRSFYRRGKRQQLPVEEINTYLGRPEEGFFHILLAHNPQYMESYFRWGADLTLSGHCHGGMIRFGEHYGLISPNLRLFCKYSHGSFQDGQHAMIVSAGLGEHTIPLRIHNPRELVIVDVHFR